MTSAPQERKECSVRPYLINETYDVQQAAETIRLLEKPLTVSDAPKEWPRQGIRGVNCQPVAAFNNNPVNAGMYYTDACFQRLKSFGVNSLRVMIRGDEGTVWCTKDRPPIPADDPMAPYRCHLEGLKVALELAEKYDMWIIPSGDNVVGRQIDYFLQKGDGGASGYFESLKQLWRHIAEQFGRHPRLLAYDLLNEPWTEGEKEHYLHEALPELIRLIREVDTNTYLIAEPPPYALPVGFEEMPVYDDPKMVYSPHWYFPHMYTHQGLGAYPQPVTYPGKIRCFPDHPEEYWDRERMKQALAPVREFQLKHNARIWVGEFSAIRWAPGAARWLEDSISIFEEYGWSWAFHAYRGWNGWNATFDAEDPTSNIDDGGKETDRLQVLRHGFARNAAETEK